MAEGLDAGPEQDRRRIAALQAIARFRTERLGYGHAEVAWPLHQALDLSRAAGLRRTEFPLVVALVAQASVSGDVDRGLVLARRARSLAREAADPAMTVMAAYALGIAHCWRGERADAARAMCEGAALYDPSMHRRLVTMAAHDAGIVCRARGAFSQFHVTLDPAAATAVAEAVTVARHLGHAHSLSYALTWKALVAIENGDVDVAGVAIDENEEISERRDFVTFRAMAAITRVLHTAMGNDAKSTLASAERAVDVVPRGSLNCAVPRALGLLGDAQFGLGRLDKAAESYARAIAAAEANNTSWGLVETLRGRARCEAATPTGKDMAANTLTRAIALAQAQGSALLELRARLDLAHLHVLRGCPDHGQQALKAIPAWAVSRCPAAERTEFKKLARHCQ